MRRVIAVSALLIFICVSSSGMAFDNHRRGFIIGGLGGVGLIIWNELEDNVKVNNGTDFVLHTDFRIGGGFKSGKILLYLWGGGNWFLYDREDGDKDIDVSRNIGVGMSYYFKPTSPSLYISAGIGRSSVGAHIFFNTGMGIIGGIGYEFAPHWSVEIDVMYGNPKYTNDTTRNTNFYAITCSLIGIAY
jgi:hypothetical protein